MSGIASMAEVEAAERRGPPALPSSTFEMIVSTAERNPEAPALTFFRTADEYQSARTWTYRELAAQITQAANFFHSLGATKDTAIAVALPNLPETHLAIWGGQATGILVALNPLLEAASLATLLNTADAKILVTLAAAADASSWRKFERVLQQTPGVQHVILVGGERAPEDATARTSGERGTFHPEPGEGSIRTSVPSHIELHSFLPNLRKQTPARLNSGRKFAASDASSWFCTGGTTGLPKLAMRTHGNEVANAWSAAQIFGEDYGVGKVTFCGLPLWHVNAVLTTGLLAFSRGAHVVLGTALGYRAPGLVGRFWDIVAHFRINFFSAVPTVYGALLQVPIGARDISSVEFGLCGAAPMPPGIFKAFETSTGIPILEGYGLTEATCVSSVNPPGGERRNGSVGLRLPGQQMKAVILDESNTYVRDCRDDEVGVLVVSGPNVFEGYRDARHNVGLWIDCKDHQRWLNTGDLARRDRDGYFWLAGRKKELIIRGGHNIDPALIEEACYRHPAVLLAAAIGRLDAHAGELPVVYAELKEPESISPEALQEYLRDSISERAAVPKAVRLLRRMPLTAVGKVYKPALRMMEAELALSDALVQAGVRFDALDVASDSDGVGMRAVVRVNGSLDGVAARRVLERFNLKTEVVTTEDEGKKKRA